MNLKFLVSLFLLLQNVLPLGLESRAISVREIGDGYVLDAKKNYGGIEPIKTFTEQWFKEGSFRRLNLNLRFNLKFNPSPPLTRFKRLSIVKRQTRFLFFTKIPSLQDSEEH